MPVRRAQGPVPRGGGSVAVLDPRGGFLRRRAPPLHVHRDRRLRSHAPAEGHELVGADVPRLRLVAPGQVGPDGTAVAGPDPPGPVVVLRYVAARPADERRAERGHQRLDVSPHPGDGVPRQERHLVDPHASLPLEEDGEPGVRVGPVRNEREPVLRPVALDPPDLRLGVRPPAGPVLFQAHEEAPLVAARLQPEVPVVGESRPDRDARLVDPVPLDGALADVHAEGALDGLLVEVVERDRVGDGVVPDEAHPVVVDAVVRVALPVAGEAEVVGRLVEAAVQHQLGGQPPLDAFVHELGELPRRAGGRSGPRPARRRRRSGPRPSGARPSGRGRSPPRRPGRARRSRSVPRGPREGLVEVASASAWRLSSAVQGRFSAIQGRFGTEKA